MVLFVYSQSHTSTTKKRSIRGKEKLQYVADSNQRKVTLSRRKATLFKNAVKLHVMTKAEVLLVIEPSKEHRIVWGSPRLKSEYENGALRPIAGQEFINPEETEETTSEHNAYTAVEPLSDTPERINGRMFSTLAHVLGHSPNISQETPPPPPRRKRIPFESIPGPVREVLVNRPTARICDNEKTPIIPEQTTITFVADDDVTTNMIVTNLS